MEQEKKKKLIFLLQVMVFWSLFFILFGVANRIFVYKDDNFYNYNNYIRQDKNTIDILAMGSSHAIDAIDSIELSEAIKEKTDREVSVFNLSATGMRIEQISYRLEEALKTQNPKLLIIETFSFAPMGPNDEEIVSRYAVDYVPLSVEKVKFIEQNIEQGKSSFYVPFIKYHTRWKELKAEDIQVLSNGWLREKCSLNGIALGEKPEYTGERDAYFAQDFRTITECRELEEEQKKALEHTLQLAENNGSKVLFLSVPYKNQINFPNTELIKCNNYIRENYVDDKNVFLLDMNLMTNELKWNYDCMQDDGHVNGRGRKVVVTCLAEYIRNNQFLNPLFT